MSRHTHLKSRSLLKLCVAVGISVALALLPLLFLVGCATDATLRREYQHWPLKPYPQTRDLAR